MNISEECTIYTRDSCCSLQHYNQTIKEGEKCRSDDKIPTSGKITQLQIYKQLCSLDSLTFNNLHYLYQKIKSTYILAVILSVT
jgi:hypothetical protein